MSFSFFTLPGDSRGAVPETLARVREARHAEEAEAVRAAAAYARLSEEARAEIAAAAAAFVRDVREHGAPGMTEMFLAEYGLATEEGAALAALAEALPRVPDACVADALIRDKIARYDWKAHKGRSRSAAVNAASAALTLAAPLLEPDGFTGKYIGTPAAPFIRAGCRIAVRQGGKQFVLGETIEQALKRGASSEKDGYLFSYDMLGEAAVTAEDAERYFASYQHALHAAGKQAGEGENIHARPGVSVKLSALHPRFEHAKRETLEAELLPRLVALARIAKSHDIALNVDAEEASRLDITLHLFALALADTSLQGWHGFGIAVQAYNKQALPAILYLRESAALSGRKITVRLVKGAYWDTEIKHAQSEGLATFPVFTRREHTDISYIACARALLEAQEVIYPQFATHNAHSAAAVLHMAQEESGASFEFQRLYGMGAALHDLLRKRSGAPCRIYAPVGRHKELLAYLVRRLLENGANSSFVNKILDEENTAEAIAADPFAGIAEDLPDYITAPPLIYAPARANSAGYELDDPVTLSRIERDIAPYMTREYGAAPVTVTEAKGGSEACVHNPADPSERVGAVKEADAVTAARAAEDARPWAETAGAAERARILNAAADRMEAEYARVFALLIREAGKTLNDAVAELREAVDFLRYYAAGCMLPEAEKPPRGLFVCISPWNFPLAIFTGQIAAALAAGNAVIAKPAEATPLIAAFAVSLLHEAGVPVHALQFLPGKGGELGAALTGHKNAAGVCFTGSTATARRIYKAMAEGEGDPHAPLIAETGGLNAAIADSSALPEQITRDVIASAFQSAGQRCSAMRLLYVQEEIADILIPMIQGAVAAFTPGDPRFIASDSGPLISAEARDAIARYIEKRRSEGRAVFQGAAPQGDGYFLPPTVIEIEGIEDLEEEIFGPVLHIARYKSADYKHIAAAVNASGYGLTFGLHTRIDARAEETVTRVRAGNIYVNRNQVGAVVGTQPFGGEGLSGTGPKAGGPFYLQRFLKPSAQGLPQSHVAATSARTLPIEAIQAAIDAANVAADSAPLSCSDMPGPSGERNRLYTFPRAAVLCLGPGAEEAALQARAVRASGAAAVIVAPGAKGENALGGAVTPEVLTRIAHISAVCYNAGGGEARALRQALAVREGAIVPLISTEEAAARAVVERHLCVNTAAAGGDAALLSGKKRL